MHINFKHAMYIKISFNYSDFWCISKIFSLKVLQEKICCSVFIFNLKNICSNKIIVILRTCPVQFLLK